jgi:hypothetical protein
VTFSRLKYGRRSLCRAPRNILQYHRQDGGFQKVEIGEPASSNTGEIGRMLAGSRAQGEEQE